LAAVASGAVIVAEDTRRAILFGAVVALCVSILASALIEAAVVVIVAIFHGARAGQLVLDAIEIIRSAVGAFVIGCAAISIVA